jgi:hypothetical protein
MSTIFDPLISRARGPNWTASQSLFVGSLRLCAKEVKERKWCVSHQAVDGLLSMGHWQSEDLVDESLLPQTLGEG